MLLSLDWDYCSGSREHVFDAPLWGTPDREHDREARWRERARNRDAQAAGWEALDKDFLLYDDGEALLAYLGVPTFVAWSHAHAWSWLERFPGREVHNFDSHHDLFSLSGEKARLRPGNWAGLALRQQLVSRYRCVYPCWHQEVRVAEGYDLARTRREIEAVLSDEIVARIEFVRGVDWPPPPQVESLLLVQSPSWTSPAHDGRFLDLARALHAMPLSEPYLRPYTKLS
ncbi:hypothetical protein [Deinococcus peraridilitoris]|uniref:Uncharacterized protein n=1 Tax=Deinococcus peraridilitoris (strain DSM 19664 / LMG 22246 / CIP 109416 / KR-200) TaxID=937777 RepID=L0A3V0_DEIPD|nr:hypothetical protein [Deinococcus peraridilitoris]AFZ68526.1 hypothetical protein Deipe_3078 [Deinococcus peraridilitoris DSM 19664]